MMTAVKSVAVVLGIATVVAGIVFGWALVELRDSGSDDYETVTVTFTEEPTLSARVSSRRSLPQFRIQRGIDPTGELVAVRDADFEIGTTVEVLREIGTRRAVLGPVEDTGPKCRLAAVFAGLGFLGAGVLGAFIILIAKR